MALAYWSLRHYFGLRLPPLGLPNGPMKTEDTTAHMLCWLWTGLAFFPHWLLYRNVLRLTAPICKFLGGDDCYKGKALEQDYAVIKTSCPADFFNTNPALTLTLQSVCRGDPKVFLSGCRN